MIKFNKLFIKISVITGLLFLAITILLIVVKNKTTYHTIERILYDFTGLKVELIEPKTTIKPNLDIDFKANQINIYNKDKTINFLNSYSPEISIKPLGFIFKKANIKKITSKEININIKRNEKGEIDLLKELKPTKLPDAKNFTITRLSCNVNKLKITFNDNYQIKAKTTFDFSDTDIYVSKRKKLLSINQNGTIETIIGSNSQKADLKIDLKAKYISNDTIDDIKTDISINNFNLRSLKDLANIYISKDISGLDGIVDFSAKTESDNSQNLDLNLKNLAIKLKNGKTIIPYKEDIKLNGNVDIKNNNLNISNITLKSNNLFVSITGKIKKLISKNPDIDLSFETKDTQINSLVYFLPDNLIYYQPKGIPTLKESNFYGVANGKINLKLFPLDIQGNLKVSDVHIPNFPKSYRNNDVYANFMKDKLKIYTRVYTPENEYVTVEGISNLDDSLWGKYSVQSTSKIDLKFAKLYLVPVQQIIGFNIGPVPIMNLSGYGNIDIRTQGTVKDAQIFGEFNAYGASAEIKGLDGKIVNGDCKLVFDDRNLIFKKIKGKLDGADFLLTGTGNTKGEVELTATVSNGKLHNILRLFKNSLMTEKYSKLVKDIAATSGNMDVKINLKGKIDNYEDETFLSRLTPSGNFNFKNNNITLNNKISVKNLKGELDFGQKQYGDFEFKLNNSKVNAKFSSKDGLDKIISGNNIDIESLISSEKFEFSDIISELSKVEQYNFLKSLSNIDFYTKFNIKSQGLISINNFDLSKLKNKGYILGLNSEKNKNIKFKSGIIKLNNENLFFDNFILNALDGNLQIKGTINKFLNNHPNPDIIVNLNNINLKALENLNSKIKLNDGTIKTGKIEVKGDNIKLNSISMNYQSMPVFINANLRDIFSSRIIDAQFSTIMNEATSDNLINPYLTYPVKITGEVPLKGTFKGRLEDFFIDFTASLPKDSDIYFSGANIGDTNLKRDITGKVEFNNKIGSINLNNLRLIKYISNQNGKINPLISFKINGQITQNKEGLNYNNLKIATSNPVNVRILNLIFKKSLLKKGNFECNINLKGDVKAPKVTGKFTLQDLDIPLYDTIVDNIKFFINENYIDGELYAKSNSNDIKLNLKAINNFKPPYIVENIDIASNKIDIIELLDSITPTQSKNDIQQKQENLIKIEDVIIKNGRFDFKDVSFDKLKAENLKGNFIFKDSIFDLKNINFDLAEGKINANGKYGIKSKKLKLSANMEGCNSNIVTKDFLKTPDQIFGKMNGSVELVGKDLTSPDGVKNVSSAVSFSIDNGKMPKLGSLEYLLRAGNLIKNGLLGLSLNNIIQVLTPYKTGEFDKISGKLSIDNGKVNNLEIMSKGKNLSLYLTGSYDILQNNADIKIYGKLSQNISNALGALGNASISQFINSVTVKTKADKLKEYKDTLDKIPAIETETTTPRFFRARVLGDINKDNYIKDFNWMN